MKLLLPFLLLIFCTSFSSYRATESQTSQDIFRIVSQGEIVDSEFISLQQIHTMDGIELVYSEHPVIAYSYISFDITLINKNQYGKALSFSVLDGVITDEQRLKLQDFDQPTRIYIDRILLHGDNDSQQKMPSIFFEIL